MCCFLFLLHLMLNSAQIHQARRIINQSITYIVKKSFETVCYKHIAMPEVFPMEILPAFQTRSLPKILPYLARVSSSLTTALIPQEIIPYRSYELERCHLPRSVRERTQISTKVRIILCLGEFRKLIRA